MSTLSTTTVTTANGTTNLTLSTGNTSGGRIVVGGTGGLSLSGNSSSNNMVIAANGAVTMNAASLSVNGNAISPVQSFRNKIINGNFDFWQRGTSVTGVTDGQFVADRWKEIRTGTTVNVSRQSFTLGQTDVPGEPTYFHRNVVTSVAGAGNYYQTSQLIESVRTFAGQTATLSFWAKADASKNMAIDFFQHFGTGGSPSSSVSAIGVTTCALTTSWQKFTVTVNVPSISGKTIGSDNNHFFAINFWFDAGSNFNSRTNSLGQQSGTFDIAQVQLEAGSVATPFEDRPLGVELALCQRYYEKSYGVETAPGTVSALGEDSTRVYANDSFAPINVRFKVTKRIIPSVSIYSPDTGTVSKVRNKGAGTDLNGVATAIGPSGLRVLVDNVAITPVTTVAIHWTAEAEF